MEPQVFCCTDLGIRHGEIEEDSTEDPVLHREMLSKLLRSFVLFVPLHHRQMMFSRIFCGETLEVCGQQLGIRRAVAYFSDDGTLVPQFLNNAGCSSIE